MVTSITVMYESEAFVAAALQSVVNAARQAAVELEVIVVDNASADGGVALVERDFPRARMLRNPENIGFAAANNQGFEVAGGDVWLLVNPDATLDPDCILEMVRFLESHPLAGAVGASIDTPFGRGPESAGMRPGIRSMAGHFLYLNRLLPGTSGGPWQGWQLASRPELGPRLVDWIGGTVAGLRPQAVRSVGGFDSSIFLYFEDVELGERLRSAGWDLWLVPSARARHEISHGRTSTEWLEAMYGYYGRRANGAKRILVAFVVVLGLGSRAVIRSAHRGRGKRAHEAKRARANARRAASLFLRALLPGRSRHATSPDDHQFDMGTSRRPRP